MYTVENYGIGKVFLRAFYLLRLHYSIKNTVYVHIVKYCNSNSLCFLF